MSHRTARNLFPPLGIISILALTLGTVGLPSRHTFGHLWPIAAFTVCGIAFALILYRTPRQKYDEIYASTFGWLPVFLGAISYAYWYWYASGAASPDIEFFHVAAEVLPVLLLAAVVDVRRAEQLQSKQLVLPIAAVFLGEIAALNVLAFGNAGPTDFAAVASSFVSSIVALTLAVMANVVGTDQSGLEVFTPGEDTATEIPGADISEPADIEPNDGEGGSVSDPESTG